MARTKSAQLTKAQLDAISIPPPERIALADGGNLYWIAETRGRPAWLFKYRHFGKATSVSFGRYPDVSIDAARAAAKKANDQIRQGINPSAEKSKAKDAAYVAANNTLGKVGIDFRVKDDHGKSSATIAKHLWEYQLLAPLHGKPIASITAPMLLKVLEQIAASGRLEAAKRAAQYAERLYRYAINRELCLNTMNPAANLRGELPAPANERQPAITDPRAFGQLMQMIDTHAYAHPTVQHGLQLLARTALRNSELRQGEWKEINFDTAEWIVPAHRDANKLEGKGMKMRRPHLVPLSRQSLAILREQQKISGDGRLIFPQLRSAEKPISENALSNGLLALFIPGASHVPHGFRSSFSTIMNNRGVDSALTSLQLSHAKRDKVAGIYDRSERVPDRVKLMQDWSDLIDEMKAGVSPRLRS